MRKLLSSIIFTMFLFVASQSISFGQEFVKGTKMLSVGLGAGIGDYGLGIQSNIDIGITDKLGIGYIGIGALVGVSGSRHNYNKFGYGGYSYSYFNTAIAARASYHFDLDIDKLDLYAGAVAGLNFRSGKYDGPSSYGYANDNGVFPLVGPFAGARYMFTDNFGVYGELGLGYYVSLLNAGITFKF